MSGQFLETDRQTEKYYFFFPTDRQTDGKTDRQAEAGEPMDGWTDRQTTGRQIQTHRYMQMADRQTDRTGRHRKRVQN